MLPNQCNDECHNKRLSLFIFYGVLLGVLMLLALTHFVFFLLTRRKAKYEAWEYATRKLNYVNVLPVLQQAEDDIKKDQTPSPIKSPEGSSDEAKTDGPHNSGGATSPSSSPISSVLDRYLNGDKESKPLEKIDEETQSLPSVTYDPIQRIRSAGTRSSTGSTVRGRTLSGGLQEPVIVTVATVSALFQHEISDYSEDRRFSGGSSVIDISDIVNSPSHTVKVKKLEDDVQSSEWGELGRESRSDGELGSPDHHDSDRSHRLEVRMGNGGRSFGRYYGGAGRNTPANNKVNDADGIYSADGTGTLSETDSNSIS